jgi:MerR HTH family regulatory protein
MTRRKSRFPRLRAKPSDADLIDRHAAAQKLGVEVRTLHRWHRRGFGPARKPFHGDKRDVYYSLAEVEQWIFVKPKCQSSQVDVQAPAA